MSGPILPQRNMSSSLVLQQYGSELISMAHAIAKATQWPWSGLLPGTMLISQSCAELVLSATSCSSWESWPCPLLTKAFGRAARNSPRQHNRAYPGSVGYVGPAGMSAGELALPLNCAVWELAPEMREWMSWSSLAHLSKAGGLPWWYAYGWFLLWES